jgi:hypothetical protein
MRVRTLISVVCVSALSALGAVEAGASTHKHSVSTSVGHNSPASDCSDLHIRIDDQDAVVKSEERTVSKTDAPMLRVRPHSNGGVQIQGWDKDVYSVTACKAAVGSGGDAERLLSQISLSIQNGEVSTKGPGDDDQWTVYLLIRAPRAAAIDLHSDNGPISLFSVDGKLTAKTTNGPISLHDVSGDAEISAVNGPVDIAGGSGNVHVHTQNGPISVALHGTSWNGAGLSVDAQNGPLSLRVPSDYQSSFVVESKGYSPVSCHASICDQARKTWDDEHRRIEFGNAPATIRLSTVNGPVSVQTL